MKIAKITLLLFLIHCFTGCNSNQNSNANSKDNIPETAIHTARTAPQVNDTPEEVKPEASTQEEENGQEGSDYLEVTITDNDGDVTNIREKPSGKIVMSIPTNRLYQTTVCEVHNKWWYVCRPIHQYEPDDKDIDLPETGGWIHSSVLTVSTRNYGGQELQLLAEPNKEAKAVFSFKEELTFHPIDKKGEWIKVENKEKKAAGWIKNEWLCGNAVTNCS